MFKRVSDKVQTLFLYFLCFRMIGHFTVMVADRNIRVGCGMFTHSTDYGYKTFGVTCNFATNNVQNEHIYAECENPGSLCVTGKNPKYPNLCSTSEVYDLEKW